MWKKMIKFAATCAVALLTGPAYGGEPEDNCRIGTQLTLRVIVFMQGIDPWKLSPANRLVVHRQAYDGTVLAKLLTASCPNSKAQRLAAGLDMAWLDWITPPGR